MAVAVEPEGQPRQNALPRPAVRSAQPAAARVRDLLLAPPAAPAAPPVARVPTAAERVRALVRRSGPPEGGGDGARALTAAETVRKMMVPTELPGPPPVELAAAAASAPPPPLAALEVGAARAAAPRPRRRRPRRCAWWRRCARLSRSAFARREAARASRSGRAKVPLAPPGTGASLFGACCADADASDEVAARHWLRYTAGLHAVAGSVMACSTTFGYFAFARSGAFSLGSLFVRCVIARLVATGLVAYASRSLPGAPLDARRLLKKLPRVLVAKVADICASVALWGLLLPTVLGFALAFHDRRPALAFFLYVITAANVALDVPGSLFAYLAVSRMCARLPELAAREAGWDGGDDDDDDDDDDEDMVADVSGLRYEGGDAVGFSPLV